jgi:hypothetical protein
MFALFDDERRTLLQISGLMCAGACAVLPLTMPPQSFAAQASVEARAPLAAVPSLPAAIAFPPLDLARDPFVPDGDPQEAALGAVAAGAVAGDGGASLRAIVLGDDPRALLETTGDVRVLGIGDSLGDDRIVSIDASGVGLSSGKRLTLAKAPQ